MNSLNLKAGLVSLLIFLSFLGIWFLATQSSGTPPSTSTAGMTAEQIEYQKRQKDKQRDQARLHVQ